MIVRTLRQLFQRAALNRSTRLCSAPRIKNRRLEAEMLESRSAVSDWGLTIMGGTATNPLSVFSSNLENVDVAWQQPLPGDVVSIKWDLPGSSAANPVIFKDYVHNRDRGEVMWVTGPPPTSQAEAVAFYWGPLGGVTQIKVTVTVQMADGTLASQSITGHYNVVEPSLDGQINPMQPPTVGILPGETRPWFMLGPAEGNGIIYGAAVHSGQPGDFFYIQLVSAEGEAQLTDGTPCARSTAGYRLDGGSTEDAHYPNPQPSWPTDNNGNATPMMADSPRAPLLHSRNLQDEFKPVTELEYSFSAKVFLMFESSDVGGARPVPVARAEYNWGGTVRLKEAAPGVYEDGYDVSDWDIVAVQTSAGPLQPTDSWPEWGGNSYQDDYTWSCPVD